MKILVAAAIHEAGLKIMRDAGLETDCNPDITEDELFRIIPGYDGLVVRTKTKITKKILERAAKLKVIALASVGFDKIDLEAATEKGVLVLGLPDDPDMDTEQHGNFISVAEQTIGLMLALSRHLLKQIKIAADAGLWDEREKYQFKSRELFGKTLGIIGIGRIGRLVAKRALAFGMKIKAYDPFLKEEYKNLVQSWGVELVTIDNLLKTSDFITIHTPKNQSTIGIIGERELAMMKNTAYVLNCARGGLISEAALAQALKEEKISGAAVDVFEKEPLERDNPLCQAPNCVLTPHMAGPTCESLERMARDSATALVRYLKDNVIIHALNAPYVNEKRLLEIKPYMNLGGWLGAIICQLIEPPIAKLAITYHGGILTKEDGRNVTQTVVKHILRKISGREISYVNALAKARGTFGIEVEEKFADEPEDYSFLLEIELSSPRAKNKIIGTILDKKSSRIIKINDYLVEARPSRFMLLAENKDVPGVIGKLGTILGEAKINIADFHLGRHEEKNTAFTVINTDLPLPPETLESIKSLPEIIRADSVEIDI